MRHTWVFLALAACQREPELGVRQHAVNPPHEVIVNDDGTFVPQRLDILEGDTVVWKRAGGKPFESHDAIARVGVVPSVPALPPREQVCGVLAGGPTMFELSPDVPAINFSGPARKGVSGLHVLSPRGHGTIETTNQPCGALDTDPNDAILYDQKVKLDPNDTVDGTTRRLCQEEKCIGTVVHGVCQGTLVPAGAEGHLAELGGLAPSVWANPDLDGVVLRVRWNDLQSLDPNGAVVTDWSSIDRAFRKALETGKTVSIDVHAGEDVPDFIFDPNHPAGGVVPVRLKDFYSPGPTPNHCGTEHDYASPNDPVYLAKVQALYTLIAGHLKADARFFQLLGYVKVSGLNLTTGENMLPHRCLDPADPNQPNNAECVCNTEIWDSAHHRYTPAGLYTFYNNVENTILVAFHAKKSMMYQLIQDGFPRVGELPGAFHSYWDPGGTDYPAGTEQTENVIGFGGLGRFAHTGDPNTVADDPQAAKLFVTMHAGLEILGEDQSSLPAVSTCKQTLRHTLAIWPAPGHEKYAYDVYYAGGAIPEMGGENCPNEWAVEQGYAGQLIGFQNSSGIVLPEDIDSSLWNLTSASNAAYFEMYEEAAWRIGHTRGTGEGAAPLDDGSATSPSGDAYHYPSLGIDYWKNLHEWGEELHDRRRRLEQRVLDPNQPYAHLADPFPIEHRHTFSNPIPAGVMAGFYYINPGRCLAGGAPAGAKVHGLIRVIGI